MNWSEALPNLLIGLREGLEAGLVVTILLAAVRRVTPQGERPRTAAVWLGVVGAVSLSISAATVLTFATDSLSSRAQEVVGGLLSVIAVGLVTWMIFWMRRTARSLSGELRGKVGAAMKLGAGALTLTAFFAVAREGLETMLFLWTAARAAGESTAPIVGAAVGIAIAALLCVLLFRRAVKINLGVFFSRTAILLIIIAAGILAYGMRDLQDAGWLPGLNWVAFDLSAHIDAGSWWVTLISGITNLTPQMTVLSVVTWVVYLAVVLGLFVWTNRGFVPAAAVAGPDEEPGRVARLVAAHPWQTGGAVVLAPAIVAGAAALALPASHSNTTHVIAAKSSCGSGWSGAAAGRHTFAVQNTSSESMEVQLLNGSGSIAGELEVLGPGTTANLSANLAAGSYSFKCLSAGGKTTVSAAAAVHGTNSTAGPAPYKQVTVAELSKPGDAYRGYVRPQLDALAEQVATLQKDLTAGNTAAAKRDWLAAQLTWCKIGAAYGSFGATGDAIDGLAAGLPKGVDDPDFVGLHRIEYGLWHGQAPAGMVTYTHRLTADIGKLKRELPTVTIDPGDLPLRAHEILEDTQRDRLSGDADYGSGTVYAQSAADLAGDRVVVGLLRPLLDARRPGLVKSITSQQDAFGAALNQAKRAGSATVGGYLTPARTPARVKQEINGTLGHLLETISAVPTLLELPPNA